MSISRTQIEYVLALEQTGSFSKAAEKCFVTQSTLSTMIKKMENQINMVLFDRKSKPILPTKECKLLMPQFKIMLREYEHLEEHIQGLTKNFHGTFKIGILPTLAPFLLPLFLNKLITKYQDVNFSIHEITTKEIVELLKQRELDIGILSLPINEDGLNESTLFYEDFLVYDTNKSDDQRSKKTYKIDDIDMNRLWLLEESHCMSNQIVNICQLRKKRKINANLIYNSGSIFSLLEFVNINQGITLLPRLAAQNEKLVDQSCLYDLQSPRPVRAIGVLTHPNFSKNKLKEVLEKQIIKAVKPHLKRYQSIKVIEPQ